MYVNDYTEGRTETFPCKQWLRERTTIYYIIYTTLPILFHLRVVDCNFLVRLEIGINAGKEV